MEKGGGEKQGWGEDGEGEGRRIRVGGSRGWGEDDEGEGRRIRKGGRNRKGRAKGI